MQKLIEGSLCAVEAWSPPADMDGASDPSAEQPAESQWLPCRVAGTMGRALLQHLKNSEHSSALALQYGPKLIEGSFCPMEAWLPSTDIDAALDVAVIQDSTQGRGFKDEACFANAPSASATLHLPGKCGDSATVDG
jgi:hypothetical protein